MRVSLAFIPFLIKVLSLEVWEIDPISMMGVGLVLVSIGLNIFSKLPF